MTVQRTTNPLHWEVLEELPDRLLRYPNKQEPCCRRLDRAARARLDCRPHHGEVGEVLGLTPAYVKGVVTFYTMYHQHPVGKNFVQVCTTSPATSAAPKGREGAARAKRAVMRATSPEGKWTIVEWSVLVRAGSPPRSWSTTIS